MDDANLSDLGAETSASESTEASVESPSTSEVESQASESESPSLEDQLNDFNSQETNQENEGQPSNALLDQLNDLGVIRQGMPVEFDDVDKVKEYLSKGFDYTAKTMELADQRKEFESQMQAQQEEIQQIRQEAETFRNENQEKLTENEVMGQVLSELRDSDPDAFNYIANAYSRMMGTIQMQNNNPVLQGVNQKISELEKQLQSKNQEQEQNEISNIQQEWTNGLQEVQSSFGPKLRQLGIKPNWQKVQNNWKSDKSGQTSVKEAFFAVHGDQIHKALEAQSRLNATRAKSNSRMGPQKTEEVKTDQNKSVHGSGTYLKDLESIAAKYV